MTHAAAEDNYPKVYLYRRVVQAKLFIDANFTSPIDVDAIADEACFSKFHFIRLFKKIYGKTPHNYLMFVRIEKAMKLLNANTPVSDVCHDIGFESLSSFSGLFKKRVGVTPSVFLAQQQALKLQMTETPLKFVPGCFISQSNLLKNSNFEEARP